MKEIRKKVKEFQKKNSTVDYLKQCFSSSKIVVFMAGFTIIMALFLWNSASLFQENFAEDDSGIGAKSLQKLGDQEVFVMYRSQNVERNYFEVILKVSDNNLVIDRTYQAAVVNSHSRKKYESELTFLYGDYYLVTITNLASDWQQLILAFGYETSIEEKQKTYEVNFNFVKTEVKESDKVRAKSFEEYILLMSDLELAEVKESISETKKIIEDDQATIKELQQKIGQNLEDLQYQFGTEKEKTETANERLTKQKKDSELKITVEQQKISDLENQLQKVEERKEQVQPSGAN